MTIPPNSGVTLTTPSISGAQKNYNNVIYTNPATISSVDLSTFFGAAVVGTSYGTATVPHWTLTNLSTIIGYTGVQLNNGGLVDNHADTSGIYGTLGNGVVIQSSAGTVTNQGTILASAPSTSMGVYLGAGGAITNGSTTNANALIAGQAIGAYVRGAAGSITNYGSIQGQVGVSLSQGGIVTNIRIGTAAPMAAIRGDTVAGVIIAQHPGTVINSGVIRGAIGIEGKNTTIAVTNTGMIYGINRAGVPLGAGVYLQSGGSVGNLSVSSLESTGTVDVYATLTQTGTITGGSFGIEAVNRPAYVINYGEIAAESNNGTGIELSSGRIVNDIRGAMIAGTGGVVIQGGAGTLVNHTGAMIEASGTYSNSFAVRVSGDVYNFGSIGGGAGVSDGVAIVGSTTILPMVDNDGTIIGRYAAVAINGLGGTARPQAELSNYNLSGPGLIQGGDYGVVMSNVTGTVFNGATIKALGGVLPNNIATGLSFYFSNGTIDNGGTTTRSAYIFGKIDGVYVHNGAATITNFGTIKGGTGISTYGGTHSNTVINFGTIIGTNSSPRAVFFGRGNSRLVDEPGAAFIGSVFGRGNSRLVDEPGAAFIGSVFGNAGTNVLELASAAAAGTVTGLGINFSNFGSITVDLGATWYIDGSDFVALTNSGGTVENSGILSVRNGGTFTNDGTVANYMTLNVGTAGLFSNVGIVHGGITVQGNATLANQLGTVANSGNAVIGTGLSAVVRNFAAIVDYGTAGSGILLMEGGTVANGTSLAHSLATIQGVNYGVSATATDIVSYGVTYTPSIAVTNYGTISGTTGVRLDVGGLVANGRSGVTTAQIYGNADGIHVIGGTVTNDGTVTGKSGVGIFLDQFGKIINGESTVTSALITGGSNGLVVRGAYLSGESISNYGMIRTDGLDAINISDGSGIIVNGGPTSTAALIAGNRDGIFDSTTVTAATYTELFIANFGTMQGTIGVDSQGATQLTNFGTIIGSGGTAVQFGPNNAVLIDEPGAVFSGKIRGGTAHNMLELAAGTPAATGDIFGFGSYVANFATVFVEPAAAWTFVGNSTFAPGTTLTNDGAMLTLAGDDLVVATGVAAEAGQHGTIYVGNTGTVALLGSVDASQLVSFTSGNGLLQIGDTNHFFSHIDWFIQGDTIDLVNLTANTAAWSGSVLTISSGGIAVAELTLAGDYTGARFFVGPDGTGGTAITTDFTACFVAGTRITTRRGEIAVEELRQGDVVWARFAGWTEIRWLGHRHIDCRRHPNPRHVWPVRIAAGAFGPGRPRRELWLSPDHAVFLFGVLIPIKHLINGSSIAQMPREAVSYYHVELQRHDVLLADGLPAESYLDTGDRANFANGGGPVVQHPDFAIRTWEAAGCAPLIVTGPQLDAARRWLNALAAATHCATVAA